MHILVLVGPKGCGKTHIGRCIQKEIANASFLEIEIIALRFMEKNSGSSAESWKQEEFRIAFFDEIRHHIQELVMSNKEMDILVFESTGAAPETKAFLEDLKQLGHVSLIRVRASTSTCAARIQSRDATRQINTSKEMIERVHAITEALDWSWDLEIANDTDNEKVPQEKIIEQINTLIINSQKG